MKKMGLAAALALLLGFLFITCIREDKGEDLIATYGKAGNDGALSIQQTADGGFIVTGFKSVAADAGDLDVPSKTRKNVWLLRLAGDLDQSGEMVYGSVNLNSEGRSVDEATINGGIVVAGACQNATTLALEACVLKIGLAGELTWQSNFSFDGTAQANSVRETSDGSGYIVAGFTSVNSTSATRAWVMKLNSTGGTAFGPVYASPGSGAYSVVQTSDGGYIATGFIGNVATFYDVLLVKLDGAGGVSWTRNLDFGGNETGYSVAQSADGGYIIGGAKYPAACSYAGVPCSEQSVALIVKTDGSGVVTVWPGNTFAGESYARAYSIVQSADLGYVAAGYTGGLIDVTFDGHDQKQVNKDFYVVKLDASGNLLWQRIFGGINDDVAHGIQELAGGGYVVAGVTGSYGLGGSDAWVLLLDGAGNCGGDSCPD